MKILLHICCAPCSIYTIKEILKDNADNVTGFYFNPNIHPYNEYLNRRKAVESYSGKINVNVIYPDYEPEQFFRGIIYNENKPLRCRACWRMRLERTALHAKEKGFDAFSTTLLISPYQDHFIIKSTGEELARKFDTNFYYRDFRPGFGQSQKEAAALGLYRQQYCGCIYSEIERFRERDSQPECTSVGAHPCVRPKRRHE